MPFCRSSAFMLRAFDKHEVMIAIAMMPAFLQSFAKLLPLYYVNEALRAAMIFVDNTATLHNTGVTAIFAAVAFTAGTFKTRWDEGT